MPEIQRVETLLGEKTPGIIANEIIMSRVLFEGSFLLVEGPDDFKFWQTRICEGLCEIIIAEGKPNLLGAIVNLNARSFVGALGIIDDDGDSLENEQTLLENLIPTDSHDLECLLLQSPAFERGVLTEFGNEIDAKLYNLSVVLKADIYAGPIIWQGENNCGIVARDNKTFIRIPKDISVQLPSGTYYLAVNGVSITNPSHNVVLAEVTIALTQTALSPISTIPTVIVYQVAPGQPLIPNMPISFNY